MKSWLTALFTAGIFSNPAWANSLIEVRSSIDAQTPYALVYESDKKETDRAPGIYALVRGEGEPEMLVAGKVLDASKAFNGILGQFSVGQTSRNYESLAVVNGRLVIFNKKSLPDQKNSLITLGENAPLVDAITGAKVALQPLLSTAEGDLNVQLIEEFHPEGQVFLISVKQPNIFGNGITFAAVLKRGTGTPKLLGSPLIIDYSFLNATKLRRLHQIGFNVFSRNHLLSLAQSQANDDRILRRYREAMAKFASALKGQEDSDAKTRASAKPEFTAPTLNLVTRQLQLDQLPTELVISDPYEIHQRVDPFSGRSGVFFSTHSSLKPGQNQVPDIEGKIDYDTTKHSYKIVDVSKKHDDRSQKVILTSVDGRVHAILTGADGVLHAVDLSRMLPVGILESQKLAGLNYPSPDGNTQYLVLSVKSGSKSDYTAVVKIQKNGSLLRPIDVVPLQRKFSPVAELAQRVRWESIRGVNTLLFDNINIRFASESDQAAIDRQSTVPFVDLQASRGNHVSQVYLKPLREVIITPEVSWRYFNPNGATVNRTGFYFDKADAGNPSANFLQGRLLTKNDQERPLAPKTKGEEWPLPDKIDPVKLAFAVDVDGGERATIKFSFVPFLTEDQVKNGRQSFELAVVLSPNNPGLAPYLTKIQLPFDFSRFQGLKLVQGRRHAEREFSLLVFVGEKENPTGNSPHRGGAGILSIPLSLEIQSANPVDRAILHQRPVEVAWIHEGSISSVAAKNRIHFDAEGRPVWVVNPELERSDRNFQLRYLTKGNSEKPLYPNQGLTRAAIRYDEMLNDDWELSFGRDSRWLIDYRSALETRFPSLVQYLEEIKKADESKKKGRRRAEEVIFPDLNNYLNTLADPQKPAKATVLLVDPELLPSVRHLILSRLIDNSDENMFSLKSEKFRFHAYDSVFSPGETLENLGRLGRGGYKRDLLFVDLETLLATEESDRARSYVNSRLPATIDNEPGDETLESEKTEETTKVEIEQSAQTGKTVEAQRPDPAGEVITRRNEDRNLVFPNSRFAYLALEGDSVNLRKFSQPLPAPRFNTLVLATPQQWRKMTGHFPQEVTAGVFNRFDLDARFLTASWSVWPPRSSRVAKNIVELHRNPISKDEYQVFHNLEQILNKISDKKAPAKHQFLVVPEEIKGLVMRLIMTRWATDARDLDGKWNYKNRELALFSVNSSASTQDQIVDNFESMRGALANRRPVLLADMSDLLKSGRPGAADSTFKLRDPVSAASKGPAGGLLAQMREEPASGGTEDVGGDFDNERAQLPHIMWWIAAEGHKVQPKKAKNWTLTDEVKPSIPTLIVTTARELEMLDQETTFERRFAEFRSMFETVQLDKPNDEEKRQLLEDLFQRPEVASLNYNFRHEQHAPDEARRQLIGLLIGKVEQISRQLKIESTYAFLKMYVTLKRALTEDVELRRSRQLDSAYIFRLFSRVFPLPLSYEILREDDKLQRLRDHERAARGLQEAGYEGALELKTRVVRGLTSHTRGGAEAGRKIPSSLVLIGDTSTGKTFMVETAIKYLGLKLYDYNKPSDEDAEAIVIRVQDLIEDDDTQHPEKISVGKALKHLSNFLSMPNGWRGLVLIDDLHKAGSTKILKELMTQMQAMFEAPGGLLNVRRMSAEGAGELREIPVRNIQLVVTLNPTKDKKKRERFLDRWDRKDPVMEAVAAITRDDYQVEDSVFARFGDVIDMSEFPREAKVPSLLNKMREANLQEFSAHPRVVAVTPRTLDVLVNTFPNSNARDFLTPATYSLLSLPNGLPKAPIYIIDPAERATAKPQGDSIFGETVKGEAERSEKPYADPMFSETSKVEPGRIEEALRSSTVIHAIDPNNPHSKLQLLSFLMDNFRGLIYNGVILGTQASPEMSQSHQNRVTLMISFLSAVIGNLNKHPRLPLANVAIKPGDLGVTSYDAIRDLQVAIQKHPSNAKKPEISIPNHQSSEERIDLDSFLGITKENGPERRRLDVLIESSRRLHQILERLLARTYQVQNLADLQRPEAWVQGLTETEPKEQFKAASQEILTEFFRFTRELYDLSLLEMRDREGVAQMQIYDESRLFLLALDNAVTQLPWSYVTEFTLNALNLATSDLAVGQKIGLQHFLFKSNYSPLVTMTPESIMTNARGISVMKTADPARTERWEQYFHGNCEKFLSSKGER